jgi:ribonuclease BN (tRNA processing enzyme)
MRKPTVKRAPLHVGPEELCRATPAHRPRTLESGPETGGARRRVDTRGVQVTFLGTGDAFGSGGRYQTCIRLRSGDATVLVDCGATSLTAMKAQAIDPGEVDAVVVTHLHGDHFGGLPFLVLDAQFSRRSRPLRVVGPEGIHDRLLSAMEVLYPGSSTAQRRFTVEVDELDGSGTSVELCGTAVRGWVVDHPSGAPPLAVRVDAADGSFGYSGDTAWTEALVAAARGTDVFACEAYTYDRPVRYHLDYQTVQAHASELETGRLVLTHMGPGMLARLDDVSRETAHDGFCLRL